MLGGTFKTGSVEIICAKAGPGLVLARADGGIPVAVPFDGVGTATVHCPWGLPENVELHWLGLEGPAAGHPQKQTKSYRFPIDRKHIHAAIAYFDKHRWNSGEHKKQAAKCILNAAKRYGVTVTPGSSVARAAGPAKPSLAL